MAKKLYYPSLLIDELNKLHAAYTLDLFTGEPIVEKPSPDVVLLLREFYKQNSELVRGLDYV